MNRKRLFLVAACIVCFVVGFGAAGSYSAAPVFAAAETEHADHAHGDTAHVDDHAGHTPSDPLSFDSVKRDMALWSLIIFLILFGILAKYAFGPIAQALDAREKAVADQISSAAQANEEAKSILAQYQQKLADSKDEVRQILETAKKDAQRNADGIIEKAKEAASMENNRVMKEIDAATANALQAIAEKSATMATELAGKMIRKEITPEAHRDLIRGALDEFAKN